MSFTTHLELYSQIARLDENKHDESDSIDYGTFTLIGRAFQLTSSIDRLQQYYSLHPTTGFDSIRGWTGPTSLAITMGIPVGFFSTAD